jgi:RHS repeat-associated protein
MTPMLYASDHLGSVRSVVNGLTGETVETNDYYPFGGKWNDGSSSDPTNRYRYNGKEEQTLFSTPYSDYGARQYSSASARWLTIDPLANKYYSISPYAFCANNPINFVDPDGKFVETAMDIISVGLGVRSMVKNIQAGNIRAAVWDGAGVAIDCIAAIIPVVPGGVGIVRNGIRVANASEAIVKSSKLLTELSDFEKAAEFGVDSYKTLYKQVIAKYGKGSNLEVHHLIEQRFTRTIGMKAGDMPSIVLTKDEHRAFTEAWRSLIGYDNYKVNLKTSTASKEDILNAAAEVYKDYPELLKTIEEIFK